MWTKASHVRCILSEQTCVWVHSFRTHWYIFWGKFNLLMGFFRFFVVFVPKRSYFLVLFRELTWNCSYKAKNKSITEGKRGKWKASSIKLSGIRGRSEKSCLSELHSKFSLLFSSHWQSLKTKIGSSDVSHHQWPGRNQGNFNAFFSKVIFCYGPFLQKTSWFQKLCIQRSTGFRGLSLSCKLSSPWWPQF